MPVHGKDCTARRYPSFHVSTYSGLPGLTGVFLYWLEASDVCTLSTRRHHDVARPTSDPLR